MEISQKLLCFLFLASFAAGIALGVIYDLLCLTRMLPGFAPKPASVNGELTKRQRASILLERFLLFIEDLGFALLGGIGLLLLLYLINDGIFRFWAPLGMACGFFVYRVTLGRLLMAVSEVLIRYIRRAIKVCLCILWFPVRLMGRWAGRWVVSPLATLLRRYREHRRLSVTEKLIQRFLLDAQNAFESHGRRDSKSREK